MAHVNLHSVYIEFPVYNIRSRSIKNQFIKMATGGKIVKDANQHIVVTALNDITLSFQHGDQIGLIGHNGSGKSTLLRLLSGIYEPTRGYVQSNGRVSAMLDIMQGIEAEFTGYENIFLRGILAGLTKKQIKNQINEICDLTGLGDYLYMPVRTYSSGMRVRLAFAVSASIYPEILLIDEVFGAGDAEFMERARKKMVTLLEQSSIVMIATHSDQLIREFCNKALLLDGGQVKYFGPVEQALALYHGS